MSSLGDKKLLSNVRKSLGWIQYFYRKSCYNSVYSGKIDTWDYQWSFTRLSRRGLSVVPSKNLVSNIGMGKDATHTGTDSVVHNMPKYELNFPLKINPKIKPDKKYDLLFFKKVMYTNPLVIIFRKVLKRLKK